MSKFGIGALVLLFLSAEVLADDFNGKVIEVIDGNTFKILDSDDQTYTVVLMGIDCPEPGQEYSEEALKCLEKIVLGKKITVTSRGKDRLGNTLGEVIIDGKKDPRVDLLTEGLAWTAEKHPSADLELLRVSASAKGKGLWKQNNPTPPWVYRREQSMLQPKSS